MPLLSRLSHGDYMCARAHVKIISSLVARQCIVSHRKCRCTQNTRKTSNYNNEDYTQKRGWSVLKWFNVPQYCLCVLISSKSNNNTYIQNQYQNLRINAFKEFFVNGFEIVGE